MSLIVYPYKRDSDSDQLLALSDQIKEPFNDLFGTESWRVTVWGSPILKKLNCELLSSLSTQDIYAEGESLQKLKNEIELVIESFTIITNELNLDLNSFKFRLLNGLEAVRIAQLTENGGVYIG
ncbi:hypothetical protein [Jiulongibacter sp. NS-SX5]|uniref:hypothetical protein n=1 Tax=Jiulongibacter sp. NS-SX5 TaxID=3463854 RepID=UPI00405814CF